MPHTLFIYLARMQNQVSNVDKEIWNYFTVPVCESNSEDGATFLQKDKLKIYYKGPDITY